MSEEKPVCRQIPDHLLDVEYGWRALLENLHEELFAIVPNYTVGQVKEKFGGLRVYLDYGDPLERTEAEAACVDLAEDLIEKYEEESYRTCEFCGEPGEPTADGWIKTLCDDCARGRRDRGEAEEP